MKDYPGFLDNLHVASPCEMLWSDMERTGHDATRHCLSCSKNVHDVSLMTREEAETLVQNASVNNADGTICLRLYRRSDGTVLTDDCPRGLRAFRDKLKRSHQRLNLVLASVCAGLATLANIGLPLPSRAGDKNEKQCDGKVKSPDMVSPASGSTLRPALPGIVMLPRNWEQLALRYPDVKSEVDKLKEIDKQPGLSEAEGNLKRCRARLAVAKAAASHNQYVYTEENLIEAERLAQNIENKVEKKSLLEEIKSEKTRNDLKLNRKKGE